MTKSLRTPKPRRKQPQNPEVVQLKEVENPKKNKITVEIEQHQVKVNESEVKIDESEKVKNEGIESKIENSEEKRNEDSVSSDEILITGKSFFSVHDRDLLNNILRLRKLFPERLASKC